MKRPSFQFYPADWLRDTALRSCSIGARGLWIDMLCFMHEGNPYGHLKVGSKVILPVNLSGMVGSTLKDVEGWLNELYQAGVYDISEDGSMYSRRMIKDENLRNMRAAGGRLGGNPAFKDNHKVNLKVNLKVQPEVKQKPTPSSSSSSSSSNKQIPTPDGVSDSVFQDFKKLRAAKKSPLTQTALDGITREAAKAGLTLSTVLEMCCERGWVGFKAEWTHEKRNAYLPPQPTDTVPSKQGIDPTLAKLNAEAAFVKPPSAEMRQKLEALRKGVLQ